MKQPLHIIIDGADGLGKTTICQMLSRTLNLPVIKMPNMKEYIGNNTTEEFSRLFNETVVQFGEYDFIMDRGFTSSIVYSFVMDRGSDLGYIDGIKQKLKAKVFILTASDTSEKSKVFRDDEVWNTEMVSKIDKHFVVEALKEGYNLISVKGKSPYEIVAEIVSKL